MTEKNSQTQIIRVTDTAYEQYLANIERRSSAAVIALEADGPRHNTKERLKALIDFIKFDEFMKTRVPGMLGLDELRAYANSTYLDYFTYDVSDDDHRAMFVTKTTAFNLESQYVSVSSQAIGGFSSPRIGLEDGEINTLEKYLFVFFSNVRIVSSIPALSGTLLPDDASIHIENGTLVVNDRSVVVEYPLATHLDLNGNYVTCIDGRQRTVVHRSELVVSYES